MASLDAALLARFLPDSLAQFGPGDLDPALPLDALLADVTDADFHMPQDHTDCHLRQDLLPPMGLNDAASQALASLLPAPEPWTNEIIMTDVTQAEPQGEQPIPALLLQGVKTRRRSSVTTTVAAVPSPAVVSPLSLSSSEAAAVAPTATAAAAATAATKAQNRRKRSSKAASSDSPEAAKTVKMEPVSPPLSSALDGTSKAPAAGAATAAQRTNTSPLGAARSSTDKKRAHNAVERRYRESINDKILELRDVLPTEWLTGPRAKTNKATVLALSAACIQELKSRNQALEEENQRLVQILLAHQLDAYLMPPHNGMTADVAAAAAAAAASLTAVSATSSASPPAADSGLSSVPSSKVTSRSGTPNSSYTDATRLLMCLGLFGLCFVTTPNGFAMSGAAPAVVGHHGGSRVLSSIGDEAGYATWLNTVIYWGLRLLTVFACLVTIFAREPLSEADSAAAKVAQEHDKKAATCVALGHYATAKFHALKSLACLNSEPSTTSWRLWLALTWQATRQLLHRLHVGLLMDRFFTRRCHGQQAAAVTMARSSHVLQQTLLMEGAAASDPTALLCTAAAVNAAEAAGLAHVEPSVVARIYVAAALHVQLLSGSHRMLDSLYLHQAAQAIPASKRDAVGALAWALTPAGRQYIRSGAWHGPGLGPLRDAATGAPLVVGTLEHLSMAYRLHLLHKAVAEFQQNADLTLVSQLLQELQLNAEEAQCRVTTWWTLAVQVAVCWRRGQAAEARRHVTLLERLPRQPTDALLSATLTTWSAHQALIDGDRALCWERLSHASAAAAHELSEVVPGGTGLPSATHTLCRALMLRQLLSTRVALYRLRSYLRQSSAPTDLSADDGNFALMLQALQKDVDTLSVFAQQHEPAESCLLLYRAVYRSLAGGRLAPTLQLFNSAAKAAHRLGLPYEEGLALLHMSACLTTSLPPTVLQRHLSTAANIFERLDAGDDLLAAKKMLRMVE